jgi:hypothetical protein
MLDEAGLPGARILHKPGEHVGLGVDEHPAESTVAGANSSPGFPPS